MKKGQRGTIEERFWPKVAFIPGHACWEWIGAGAGHGYGSFWAWGKNCPAHRVAWELLRGPIPDGLEPDHLCRNKACVNPDHLELVSHRENVVRGTSCVAVNAAKKFCLKGHELIPENLYNLKNGWRRCAICSNNRRKPRRVIFWLVDRRQ